MTQSPGDPLTLDGIPGTVVHMDTFYFEPGDEIRIATFGPGQYITVTAVGTEAFLGILSDNGDEEDMWYQDAPWERFDG